MKRDLNNTLVALSDPDNIVSRLYKNEKQYKKHLFIPSFCI